MDNQVDTIVSSLDNELAIKLPEAIAQYSGKIWTHATQRLKTPTTIFCWKTDVHRVYKFQIF